MEFGDHVEGTRVVDAPEVVRLNTDKVANSSVIRRFLWYGLTLSICIVALSGGIWYYYTNLSRNMQAQPQISNTAATAPNVVAHSSLTRDEVLTLVQEEFKKLQTVKRSEAAAPELAAPLPPKPFPSPPNAVETPLPTAPEVEKPKVATPRPKPRTSAERRKPTVQKQVRYLVADPGPERRQYLK